MVRPDDFNPTVELPPGLTVAAIRMTIDYVERELTDLVELYLEQANVFSAIVGIFAVRGLAANSVYEKSRHADLAQQRFPDLIRRGSGYPPCPRHCLECKASKRPWAVQSHYDHPGWYMVWRYLWTLPALWNCVALLSSGELMWRLSRGATGSTKEAEQVLAGAVERTRLAFEIPRLSCAGRQSTTDQTSDCRAAKPFHAILSERPRPRQ